MANPERRPLWVIRQQCLDCVGFSPKRVRECNFTWCALWPYRMGHRPKEWPGEICGARYSPRRAIRRHCLWCCYDSRYEVKLCPAKDCPSWKWRLGTPEEFKRKREMSPEQREKMAQNLKKGRSAAG